jgi:hypothetical protein
VGDGNAGYGDASRQGQEDVPAGFDLGAGTRGRGIIIVIYSSHGMHAFYVTLVHDALFMELYARSFIKVSKGRF